MQSPTDSELLHQFNTNRSEEAFHALVERHLPLVFGVARRTTSNAALAEEVAQTVFLVLANKASALGRETSLAGWLFRTTRFVAARAVRAEQRRRLRERTALSLHMPPTDQSATKLTAQLDEALACLREEDRRALLLRYFEGQTPAEIAGLLGVTDAAVKKRISRALEKLRGILSRRGIPISATVLSATLTTEGGLSVPAGFASRLVVRMAGNNGASAGAELLHEVTRALFWSKLKMAVGSAAAVITLLFLIVHYPASEEGREPAPSLLTRNTSQTSPGSSARSASASQAGKSSAVRLKNLTLTVVDANTAAPIQNAEITHDHFPELLALIPAQTVLTGPDGVGELQVPVEVPGSDHLFTAFRVSVQANGYGSRNVRWFCSTGGVFRTIQSEYTLQLKPGITLSGRVVDDTGRPLEDIKLAAYGENSRSFSQSIGPDGRPAGLPLLRKDEYSSFHHTGGEAILTDTAGHFTIKNFPEDVNALIVELNTPEGAFHKFTTPEGSRLTTEVLPKISMADLRSGTCQISLPRGIDVFGRVIDAGGRPVQGAQVTEAVQAASLRILSRSLTDAKGAFRLPSRQPRQVLLAASAADHATAFTIITVTNGMPEILLQLTPQLPLRGRVINLRGEALPDARVLLPPHLNQGLAVDWRTQADSDGRFSWLEAPTNEVTVMVTSSNYFGMVRRLRASPEEHVLVLQDLPFTHIRLTGDVTDAVSGLKIDFFKVKLHIPDQAGNPDRDLHTTEGVLGLFDFEFELRSKDLKFQHPLLLVIEAEGYEAQMSPVFHIGEGHQHFSFQLQKGGHLEGVVLAPDGKPASGASFSFAQRSQPVFAGSFQPLFPPVEGTTSPGGEFRLPLPIKPKPLVVFHTAGWAIEPIGSAQEKMTVNLKSWTTVEVSVDPALPVQPGDSITLESLAVTPPLSLKVLYGEARHADRKALFTRVPGGMFELAFTPGTARMHGSHVLRGWQKQFVALPGETIRIVLGEGRLKVKAALELSPQKKGENPVKTLVSLESQPPFPPQSFEFFASTYSQAEASRTREANPQYLDARRKKQTYVGLLDSNGEVTFHNVNPGRYILEAKQIETDPKGLQQVVIAETKAEVEVFPSPNGNEPQHLGTFVLKP